MWNHRMTVWLSSTKMHHCLDWCRPSEWPSTLAPAIHIPSGLATHVRQIFNSKNSALCIMRSSMPPLVGSLLSSPSMPPSMGTIQSPISMPLLMGSLPSSPSMPFSVGGVPSKPSMPWVTILSPPQVASTLPLPWVIMPQMLFQVTTPWSPLSATLLLPLETTSPTQVTKSWYRQAWYSQA